MLTKRERIALAQWPIPVEPLEISRCPLTLLYFQWSVLMPPFIRIDVHILLWPFMAKPQYAVCLVSKRCLIRFCQSQSWLHFTSRAGITGTSETFGIYASHYFGSRLFKHCRTHSHYLAGAILRIDFRELCNPDFINMRENIHVSFP